MSTHNQIPDYQLTSFPPDGASFDGLTATPGIETLESRRKGDGPAITPAYVAIAQGVVLDQATAVMQIDQAGLSLIEGFEGYSYKAYWDPNGGVWTVGYGETAGVTRFSTQTRPQAEADLARRLNLDYEPAIRELGVPLNQHQYDALCSFVWNLGPGSMKWDVGNYLRQRKYNAAADAMLNYVTSGGQRLQGLVNRRVAEVALFRTPMPKAADPHKYWRFYTDVELKSKRHVNERALVEKYDKLRVHGIWNRGKLVPIRAELAEIRDTVWDHAHANHPPSWGVNWRGWRYQELAARANGESVKS